MVQSTQWLLFLFFNVMEAASVDVWIRHLWILQFRHTPPPRLSWPQKIFWYGKIVFWICQVIAKVPAWRSGTLDGPFWAIHLNCITLYIQDYMERFAIKVAQFMDHWARHNFLTMCCDLQSTQQPLGFTFSFSWKQQDSRHWNLILKSHSQAAKLSASTNPDIPTNPHSPTVLTQLAILLCLAGKVTAAGVHPAPFPSSECL